MYNTKKYENYSEKERSFHKSRIAFFIKNNKINLLTNSEMSHYEWMKLLGIKDNEFNSIIRGYVSNGNIVFYKGNFTYDNDVIEAANKYCNKIKEMCNIEDKCMVYCGVKVGKQGEIWPPDLLICEC